MTFVSDDALAFGVAAVFVVGVALGTIYVLPHLLRKLAERRLDALCARERVLVLTYDDGPGPVLTSRVLDELGRHGARATFFPLGMSAEKAGSTLDRVRQAGHEIGVHSYRHRHTWKVSPWTALRDALDGYRVLSAWVATDAVFRPPYGKINLLTAIAMRWRRAPLGWWTIDSGDTWKQLPEPQAVVDRVLARGGGVVLLHDFDRGQDRIEYVVEATRRLLDAAEQKGIVVKSLGDLRRPAPRPSV